MRKVLHGILILSLLMSFSLFVNCEKDITKPPEEPEVKLVSPTKNMVLIGYLEVEITATDDKGITKVEFVVDNEVTKTWILPPYVFTWDFSNCGDSSEHLVYAKAYDADDNVTTTPVIKVLVRLLPAPTNLSLQLVDSSTVILSWDDNSIIESGFLIERKEEGGEYFQIAEVDSNITTYSDVGLDCFKSYQYRVRTYVQSKYSYYSYEVFSPVFIKDINGYIYKTIKIGEQWWMAENLKVTHYSNGMAIPNVTVNYDWSRLTTGACCDYNDVNKLNTYGRLYNWYAVTDSRNIAPAGWHIPTDAEWQTLIDYLGGDSLAGDKMKEVGHTHWSYPNINATNESGFTALPGGWRTSDGQYYFNGKEGYWWSATESDDRNNAWYRMLSQGSIPIKRFQCKKVSGCSVRCVKD